MIPRILHQSWKTDAVPERYAEFQASWRRHHPAWEYRLWTDADNLRLIDEHYPQFSEFYRRLPYPIMRADFVRPAYLHRCGGLYVDLDFEALRPLDPLLVGRHVVFGRESGGMGYRRRGRDYIMNALMASRPGHPFWLKLMTHIVDRFEPQRRWEAQPVYIIRSYIEAMDELIEAERKQSDEIVVYSYKLLYPTPQAERSIERRRAIAEKYGSFAIHHYDDSWFTPLHKLTTALLYYGKRLRLVANDAAGVVQADDAVHGPADERSTAA